MNFYKRRKVVPPKPGDKRPRCVWHVRRTSRQEPCGRLAKRWRFRDPVSRVILLEEYCCAYHASVLKKKHGCRVEEVKPATRKAKTVRSSGAAHPQPQAIAPAISEAAR